MKTLHVFTATWCPHCQNAKKWIAELKETEAYKDVPVEFIDDDNDKERVAELGIDYYYIPTFALDGKKLFEGVTEKKLVEEALEAAKKA